LTTRRKYEEVYESLKAFIQGEFSEWFGFSISNETVSFLGDNFEQLIHSDDDNQSENTSDNSIKLDIGTVHSAKGQTHCATMYVETSYFDYETNKLIVVSKKATKTKPVEYLPNPLLGQEHAYRQQKDSRAKEALKMMYVGFSRPTHLLCFACLKENVGDQIASYKSVGWEVIDLTEMN
jgi:DNA helicase-2/ATP-dependent DNA helicase PcrA